MNTEKKEMVEFLPSKHLADKKNFNKKDCIEWNRILANNAIAYIEVEVGKKFNDIRELQIPEDGNPWNIVRSLISQFYQREKDLAWERFEVQKAINTYDKQKEEIKSLSDLYWKDQEAIKALKQQTKENAVSKEDVQRLKELQEILNYNSIVDWLESMNSVISNLPEGAEQLKFDLCLLNRFFINLLKIDMYSQKDAHQTNKEE